jgi:hypothetical protein
MIREHLHIGRTQVGTARLRTLDLKGPVGNLEAVLNEGQLNAPYAALVCHPHPLGGGTLHNKVVYHAMKVLNGLGLPVLRFNFRGVGRSEGSFDDGRGEVDDVRAAVSWLSNQYKLPLVVVGFSFGSAVSLEACCKDARLRALVALGIPTQAEGRTYKYPFLADCRIPKLFLSGDQDQYGPREEVEDVVAHAGEPSKLIFVPGANHFFVGKLDAMQGALRQWLVETLW